MIPGIMAGARQTTTAIAPAIRSAANTTLSAATTHTLTMPGSIVPGDIIVVGFGTTNNPTIIIDTAFSGTGWSVLANLAATGNFNKLWVAYKVATGSDALRLNFSLSNGVNGRAYAISNAATVRSNSAAFAAPGSNIADPPSVGSIPSGADAVCLVFGAIGGSASTASAPSGYGLDFQVAGRVQCFSVAKAVTGTTEDPASYNPGGNVAHALATVVATAS